jgi:CRP-like cAMP-binding protein
LAMSVRWSGTTVMDLSKFGAGSQLVMFCVLGLLEVPFDKCDDGSKTLKSAFRRFSLGTNVLYTVVPLAWILMCQIGSSHSFNSFYCMFEVMSAFFNSGVTIANQDNADLASLSYIGSLPDSSKIILLFVMLAGRFRKVSALPAACKEAISSWKASPDSVLDMRLLNQSSGQVVLAQKEGEIEPGIQDLLQLLETVPVIQSLSRSQQISLSRLVSLENYSHGDAIIRQGDSGEIAFIVFSGSVDVKKIMSPGGAEIFLVTLQKGAFFGELALINNAPRGASVYANGETSCILLSKSTFETIRDSVVSDSKARELVYARSEIDALRLKIDDLQREISTLRRRKSATLASVQADAEASLFESASPTESVSFPGSVVDAPPVPRLATNFRAPSRPAIKVRRTLLSLPAPTPR